MMVLVWAQRHLSTKLTDIREVRLCNKSYGSELYADRSPDGWDYWSLDSILNGPAVLEEDFWR